MRGVWAAAALLAVAGCSSTPAIVLDVSADHKVDQYDLFVRDDASGEVFFSTGWTPVSPQGAAPRDLTAGKLKIALKLSRGGRFTLLLVGVEGAIAAGRPAPGATQLFWAGRLDVDGTRTVEAPLYTVPAGDDQDGDYWPDAQPFLQHVPAASALYAQHPELLDCDDKIDNPSSATTGMPIKLKAKDVNPFALELCGDGYDENCDGDGDEACVDEDKDHDFKGSDCDDHDPARHHATDVDPFPDPPNCCGYSLGKTDPADRATDYLHDPGAGCFAAKCAHDATLCPMKRCGDGVDESCAGADTACVTDEDCDGYPAPPVGNDCDDHDPNVHPNAAEPCNATKDLNCDGVIGGCVPCDLDGDGFERADAANGCPDVKDKHPGLVDCNDYDSGVYPGSTGPCGGKEGGSTTLGMATCALRGGCRTVYESTGAEASGTPRVASFAAIAGDADCDGTAYSGCPSAACDADGDGFPNASAGCNPGGALLDCDDTDPTVFPGAPDRCGDTIAQDCTADTPCAQDADGDGYNKGADCDDTNAAIHPWAVEVCNGIDDDCDGLTDEGNPDAKGQPLVGAGAVTTCTDSNVGDCAATRGVCVCSPSAGDAYTDPNGKRTFCPTEDATPKPPHPPRCFGAGQPKPQSCDALAPRDDDCDGRVDAPDGKNLALKGMPCGVAVGQCKQGTITACDSGTNNCFAQFGRLPASDKWYVCSTSAVCPTAEQCNGLDDDCDGQLAGAAATPAPWPPNGPPATTMDERDHDGDGWLACGPCAATRAPSVLGCGDCDDGNPNVNPAAKETCDGVNNNCALPWTDGKDECGVTAPTLPVCCGASGCKNTQTDFGFCGACTMACNAGNADQCVNGGCQCGSSPPCAVGVACSGGKCARGPGGACAVNADCMSNFCVDNFCCTVAACGLCQACTGTGGTCAQVKGADDPDTCTGASTCDATGACKLKQGQPCAMGMQCASTFCVNATCCGASACGACATCANAGGTCQPLPAGPQGSCNTKNACDGMGNCLLANGQACTGGALCASGNCVNAVCCSAASCPTCQACNVGALSGNCANQPAGAGNGCSGAGQSCDGLGNCKLSNGGACTSGAQCLSNFCTDGVCCMSSTCGTCKTCNGATPGMCGNSPQGPGNGCSGATQACDGGGNCKLSNGQACGTNNGLCASNHCTETVCCPVASCGACNTCDGATPGACTPQPLAPGNGCSGAGQTCDGAGNCRLTNGAACPGTFPCLMGNCADGVCCDNACSSACQRCNLAGSVGACKTAPLGTPGRTACAGNILCDGVHTACQATCSGDFTCAAAFYCSSSAACAAQLATNAACTTTACLGNTNTCRQCSGNKVCPGAACGGNANCAVDGDCAGGYYCASNSKCALEIPAGGACTQGNCKVSGCRQCAGDVACAGATC